MYRGEKPLFKKVFSVALLCVSVPLWWAFDIFTAAHSAKQRTRTDEAVIAAHEIAAINDRSAGCQQFVELRLDGTRHRPPARQRRRSSEFDTTDTELIAIAAPAITGLSMPSAASGIPKTL